MAFSSLTLLALVAAAALPQQAVVSGHVLDASSGDPVVGAQVSSRSARSGTLTGEDGGFSLAVSEDDTLVVTHGDYVEGRLVLGRMPQDLPPVDIALTARSSDAAARAVLEAAEAMAARTGASLWTRDEFVPFLGRVDHPLGLLVYSGYAAQAPDNVSDRSCVRLRGAVGCAGIWKDGERTGAGALSDSLPADVEAFVIVPPGEASVALDGYEADGIVMVYVRRAS